MLKLFKKIEDLMVAVTFAETGVYDGELRTPTENRDDVKRLQKMMPDRIEKAADNCAIAKPQGGNQ